MWTAAQVGSPFCCGGKWKETHVSGRLQCCHHAVTHSPYRRGIGHGAKLSCSSSWLSSAAGATVSVTANWQRLGGGTLPLTVSNSVTSICSRPHSSLLRNVTNVIKHSTAIRYSKGHPQRVTTHTVAESFSVLCSAYNTTEQIFCDVLFVPSFSIKQRKYTVTASGNTDFNFHRLKVTWTAHKHSVRTAQ